MAPEVLDPRITEPDGYGPLVDVWSVGVTHTRCIYIYIYIYIYI